MAYSSCAVTQANTSDITKCSFDNKEIIGIEIVTTGGTSPFDVTSFRLRTNGSTNPLADINNVDIYYTGTSPTFATTTLFGSSAPVAVATNYFINGTQTLSPGTNYFWVVYDLNPGATVGNNLDGLCNRIVVNSVNRTPSPVGVAGNRTIATCPPSPGGVSSNILFWLRADASVSTSGVNVTGWGDQSSTSTAITVNGSPDEMAVGRNYNPCIDFTYSNGVDGGDFLSTADLNVQSFFLAGQLNDLTRRSTHMVTYDQVTFAGPCAQCALHGGENGGAVADYAEISYGNGNFQSAGVWRKNGDAAGVTYSTPHSGNFDVVTARGGGTGSANRFLGGQVSNLPGFNARVRDWYGPVGDMIVYSGAISVAEASRIESYMAIKYGITLGENGSTTLGYVSSSGATIYAANSGYHNDVIGIGRDDNTVLLQKQSHTPDDTSRFYVGTLAASNQLNGGTITNDGAYIVGGHDFGKICHTAAAAGEMPLIIFSRLEREWKIENTNFSDNFNFDVKLNACATPGMVNTADLRLLVDDDGDFSNATIYAAGGGLSFAYSGGVISVLGISNTHIPLDGTKFITIASVNPLTPLPIELVAFDVVCKEKEMLLKWTTASEINNDYFTVERSLDGINFEKIDELTGAGNSNSLKDYSWIDKKPLSGSNYYRLKQTDFDGKFSYSDVKTAGCNENVQFGVHPNPASNIVTLSFNSEANIQYQIVSLDGRVIQNGDFIRNKKLDLSELSNGVYFVRAYSANEIFQEKLVKQ